MFAVARPGFRRHEVPLRLLRFYWAMQRSPDPHSSGTADRHEFRCMQGKSDATRRRPLPLSCAVPL
jgi:hypothetical protein